MSLSPCPSGEEALRDFIRFLSELYKRYPEIHTSRLVLVVEGNLNSIATDLVNGVRQWVLTRRVAQNGSSNVPDPARVFIAFQYRRDASSTLERRAEWGVRTGREKRDMVDAFKALLETRRFMFHSRVFACGRPATPAAIAAATAIVPSASSGDGWVPATLLEVLRTECRSYRPDKNSGKGHNRQDDLFMAMVLVVYWMSHLPAENLVSILENRSCA